MSEKVVIRSHAMTRKFILKLISAMRSVNFTENDIIAKKCTDLIKRRGKVVGGITYNHDYVE
jgi:hypothetical protein